MIKSKLATQIVDVSAKSNPRGDNKVIKITPHHMAGKMLADDCANMHRTNKLQQSANYYIGYDGTICIGVSEDRRAWTSFSRPNDYHAITIEVSNDKLAPEWSIPDAAYKSLVALCADICNRYNIEPHFDGTPNGSITYHSMFQSTSCPGKWLLNKIQSRQFEADIKKAMGGSTPTPVAETLYRVQCGAFRNLDYAVELQKKLDKAEFETYLVLAPDNLYKVQCGAFRERWRAEALEQKLNDAGFKDTYITDKSGTAVKINKVVSKREPIEVAKEIVYGANKGGWGDEPDRSRRLKEAGYDPKEVQRLVNQLMKG